MFAFASRTPVAFFRRLLLSSALVLGLALPAAFAATAECETGGFTGPSNFVTVRDALKLGDDDPVSLRGNILQHLGGEVYVFSDETGTVNVEIEGKVWCGQTVAPGDTVEIHGEVDKGLTSMKIEVERLILLR